MRSNPGLLSLYHLCFEMHRFPFELPAGLPDEQIELMIAYLGIRAEMRSESKKSAETARGAAAEAELQAAEAAAHARRRRG